MYLKVLAPVDQSDSYARGLLEAIWIAGTNKAQLRFLHIFNAARQGEPQQRPARWFDSLKFQGQELLDRSVRMAKAHGVGSEQVLVDCSGESGSQAIIDYSRQWGADLIVMGSRGSPGSPALDVCEQALGVLRMSEVPVLLVRGCARDYRLTDGDVSSNSLKGRA